MSVVRTVLGDIDASTLGFCSAHDHVLIGDGLGARANPELLVDDLDAALVDLAAFAAAGGAAMVDAMPLDCGRDPLGLVEASHRSGVHIIATTGFHTPHYYEADHWSTTVKVDAIADLLVAEVTAGMDRYSYGGPIVERIEARAGLVKVASELGRIAAVTDKLLEAAADCHHRTGVAILTHMEHGTMGLEQVERLGRYGVAPDAILLSHCDRNHDTGYHADLAATGAFLVYDGPTRTKYHTPEFVAGLMAAACAAGAHRRILVGMDLAPRSYRVGYGGAPGMGFLPGRFAGVMRSSGFDDAAVTAFTVTNPASALALRTVA